MTAHRDPGVYADDRFDDGDAAVVVLGDLETVLDRSDADAVDVVGVLGVQHVLDELAVGALDDAQLVATIGCGQDAGRSLGQPELV